MRLEGEKDLVCQRCSLYSMKKVEYEGDCSNGIYLIGMCPGKDEVLHRRPFVGRAGTCLRETLKVVFGSDKGFRYANCCKCFVKAGEKLPKDAYELCVNNFLYPDIKHYKPKVIIPLGEDAFHAIFSREEAPAGISDVVEMKLYSRRFNCWVVPNFHPSYIIRNSRDKGIFRRFINSFLLAKRLVNEKFIPIEEPSLRLLSSKDGVIDVIKRALEEDYIAFDFETKTTRPYYKESCIGTVSIAFGNEVYAFPLEWPNHFFLEEIEEIKSWLKKLWTSTKVKKIAHNLLFESEWIYKKFGVVLQEPVADTMVLHHGLYGGHLELHGLKFIMVCEYGVPPWGIDVSDIFEIPLEDLLIYNAYDSFYTLKMYERLEKAYKSCKEGNSKREKMRARYYTLLNRILMPLIPYVGKAQADGVPVDVDFLTKLEKDLLEEIKGYLYKIYTDETLLKFSPETKELLDFVRMYDPKNLANFLLAALKILGSSVKIKLPSKYYTKTGKLKIAKIMFNINSGKQLAKFIEYCGYEVPKTEKGNPKVDEEVLKNLTQIKVIKYYLELKKLLKKYSTYVIGSKNAMYDDNKFHSSYILIGNNTSRFISNRPNLQNFPKRKGKELRNIMCAPDGYVMISSDFSNLEVRGEAILSGDKALIEVLVKNIDQHMFWSEKLFGKEKAQEMRNKAKNGFVFPIQYGAGVETLCKGVGWTLTERNKKKMAKIRDEYWKVHTGIYQRHKRAESDYNNYGEIYDMCGRVRKAPLKYNAIINYEIQSSCFYLTMNAWLYLLRKGYWCPIELHDELVVIVPDNEKSIKQAVNDIYYAMIINNKKTFKKIRNAPVEIGCDMKIGRSFGSLKEFDWKKYLGLYSDLER